MSHKGKLCVAEHKEIGMETVTMTEMRTTESQTDYSVDATKECEINSKLDCNAEP